MFIKICGLTDLATTQATIAAGADFIGFNFYPKSPRYISPDTCASIIASITNNHSPITHFVGIFVNEPFAAVQHIMAHCGLHLAQLHGAEPPDFVAQFQGRAYKAFRGLGTDHANFAQAAIPTLNSQLLTLNSSLSPAFLLDSSSPGSGQQTDWTAARTIAAQYPIFLAGGLTPANVAAAIAQVQPWGVDVASGVESAPGVKDSEKIALFIKNAREQG